MKNLNPEEGSEIFGGRTDRDLTRKLQHKIDGMFDDELEDAVIGLKTTIDAQNAELLLLIAEYDRRRVSSTEHELSTMAWLKYRCRMSATEASGTVKTARALAEMPDVAEEAVAGNVVQSAVKLLARTRDSHPEEFADHESVFADIATYLDPGNLRRAVSHWQQQVDFPSALADTESARRSRRFFFNRSYRGMWSADGDLDPESGHVISTALHSLTDPANLHGQDTRSAPQRNADALTDICRFFLDHNDSIETSGGEKPHVTVTLDYRILSGELERLPEIDGVAVDPEALRRITCDAGIVPMVLGSDSEVLDIGRRTRTIPPSIRRALDRRDGGCTWKGCTAPASWADAHHIVHWADGGTTALDNLVLLCRRHHTATHEGKHPPDH